MARGFVLSNGARFWVDKCTGEVVSNREWTEKETRVVRNAQAWQGFGGTVHIEAPEIEETRHQMQKLWLRDEQGSEHFFDLSHLGVETRESHRVSVYRAAAAHGSSKPVVLVHNHTTGQGYWGTTDESLRGTAIDFRRGAPRSVAAWVGVVLTVFAIGYFYYRSATAAEAATPAALTKVRAECTKLWAPSDKVHKRLKAPEQFREAQRQAFMQKCMPKRLRTENGGDGYLVLAVLGGLGGVLVSGGMSAANRSQHARKMKRELVDVLDQLAREKDSHVPWPELEKA